MQDFKKIVKGIGRMLLFLLILILLLLLLSVQMVKALKENDGMAAGRNKSLIGIQKEPENTIDVLMVGDSLSYTSFYPGQLWEEQGITSYVCGQSGQEIQESYYMLKTALENQNPKVVILETNAIFRSRNGFKNLQNLIAGVGDHYFPVFRFHDMWKSLITGKSYLEKSEKGFSFREGVKPYKGGNYMKPTKKCRTIKPPVRHYLDKIINLCREKGTELILVSTPSPKNYNYKTYNALRKYSQEQSLPYLELNLALKELGIDWKKDSLDNGDHLNLSGAQKVTQYLGEYLQSNYTFADHRGDKRYDEWNK